MKFIILEFDESQQATWGFVQVWLEVVAISISNIAAFVRAGKTPPNISSYYLTLLKAKQRLRAEGMLMPHLLQSPVRYTTA